MMQAPLGDLGAESTQAFEHVNKVFMLTLNVQGC